MCYNLIMYKTGIETRKAIVNEAKILFYRNGYKKTSVEKICEAADAKLGTFTYYFPKKNDLLSTIYSDYMQACVDHVEKKEKDLPPVKHHLYSVMLYYGNLYRDERTVSFHRETLQIASMNAWFHDPRMLISEFSGRNISGMDSGFYDLCVKADNAVRRELNLDFIEKKDYGISSVKKLLSDIYLINARLFGVDRKKTEAYLEDAFDFYLNDKDNNISLL